MNTENLAITSVLVTIILTSLGLFAMVAVVVWLRLAYWMKGQAARHEERMKLIEKGIYDPSAFADTPTRKEKALLYGILLSTIGLALLVYCLGFKKDHGTLEIAFLLFFPGVGLIIYWLLTKKEDKTR
jgi:hypothetical protein